MEFTLEDALADVLASRDYFRRHIGGMAGAHWDAKPFPTVNSVRDIVAHLIATDRAVLAMMQGEPFDMAQHMERHKQAAGEIAGQTPETALALHDAGGQAIADHVRGAFTGTGDPLTLWGSSKTLAQHLGQLSQEIAYHTGQVSLLRQALEPDWDYFKDVFGMEGF